MKCVCALRRTLWANSHGVPSTKSQHRDNVPTLKPQETIRIYSLRFKINVTFGHKVCNEIKVTFGEISLKLSQTNWNVARNNVNVVADELASLLSVYTCLTIDIWTRRR